MKEGVPRPKDGTLFWKIPRRRRPSTLGKGKENSNPTAKKSLGSKCEASKSTSQSSIHSSKVSSEDDHKWEHASSELEISIGAPLNPQKSNVVHAKKKPNARKRLVVPRNMRRPTSTTLQALFVENGPLPLPKSEKYTVIESLPGVNVMDFMSTKEARLTKTQTVDIEISKEMHYGT